MNVGAFFIPPFLAQIVLNNYSSLILCPSFVHVESTFMLLSNSNLDICLGGQDCFSEMLGSYTGEVAAFMLYDAGCRYVIIGHSERKLLHQETNDLIRKKIFCALKAGLVPIVCVGESIEVRRQNQTIPYILKQLAEILLVYENSDIIIAYEPTWAIGSGLCPSLEEIKNLAFSVKQIYRKVSLLYGGSVTAKNAYSLLSLNYIDGVLIGSSGIDIDQMNEIIAATQRVR